MPARRSHDRCYLLSSRLRRYALLGVGILCTFGLVGCGDDGGLPRVEITGQLAWGDGAARGQPVEDALISFLPANGTNGPAVNADVEHGYYYLGKRTGPTAGPHRIVVSVESVPGTGPASRDPANKGGDLRRWEFQFEVPSEGPVTHNLTLDDV